MNGLMRIVCALGLAAAVTPVGAADANGAYPTQPVRLLIPQIPGGSTDILARLLAQKLTEKWGQQVVVDNRGGANGIIGSDIAAKSAPNGYTLLFTYVATYAINTGLYKKLPYDSIKDFSAVANVANVPFILVVNNNLPAKNLKDLVTLAKAKPGELSFGASTGALGHLIGAMVNQA
jgi:tripartite-type tricarboxylate transporter receptor subunit TctC